MPILKDSVPDGFVNAVALPKTSEQAQQWQEANRLWWENHPMRYDWNVKIRAPEFSPRYFQEIDERFFSQAREYLPYRKIPFDVLIDYDSLKNKDVLEIGIGSGCHAQLLAAEARSFTGIDLTAHAVKSTSERMKCFGLRAAILQMDAERMEFGDSNFDLVWSWGVIHHSADPRCVLKEIYRVLKPGGMAVIMVYHRSFWNYYVLGGICHGLMGGDLFRTRSLHKTMQRWMDGAIARFYSISEWKQMASQFFTVERIFVCGSKPDFIPLPAGKLKDAVLGMVPAGLCRFFTNRLGLGGFLVSTLIKDRDDSGNKKR
ncbi:MAG: class I SAM-dependent methyltransferase [Candidatus Omnitrophica bacterium]|nr:class I SAM-dependent methyltransferase [Candidatus Omnitrophota bacterium]